MLPIPECDWSNREVLASWLELSALSSVGAIVTRGEVAEMLRDSQLWGPDSDGEDSDVGEVIARVVGEVWKTLEVRQSLLQQNWPFVLTSDRFERGSGFAVVGTTAAYATMLLIEAASMKWYRAIAIQSGDPVREWFEHIAAFAIGKLVSGKHCRFGAPFPPDWTGDFANHVERLASVFDVAHRPDQITKFASPEQQDDSLDVVARWKLLDEEASSPYLLVQCATGANWGTAKPGQPSMDLWQRYITWNGPVFKSLAVPFALRQKGELENACVRHGTAIVFDRLRLAAGAPDSQIDSVLRTKLVTWCTDRFERLAKGNGVQPNEVSGRQSDSPKSTVSIVKKRRRNSASA